MATKTLIPGYTYGTEQVAKSPIGLEDLNKLKTTVMFTSADEEALRMAGDVLEDQVEDVLDVWYGFVADHPHLLAYFWMFTRDRTRLEWVSAAEGAKFAATMQQFTEDVKALGPNRRLEDLRCRKQ